MNKTDKQKVLNVFDGDTSVMDFLNPDNAPYTPLIEIPKNLNPYHSKGVRVFAKMMGALPLANVKSLPALNMLLEAKENGALENIDTVIENSSGNTVLSLAVIARLFGINKTKAVVSHEVTKGKLNLLRFLGTEIIVNEEPICPDPNDKTSGIYKSKQWAKENNWFNPGQYDNEDNPNAHYRWTAPQIWEQTKGKIDVLSVGLGTTGSVVGLGTYLKKKKEEISIIGVSRIVNNPVPGVRTNNLLKEIAFDWNSNVDYQEEVGTVESFRLSLELCRAGILAGPSSGFALKGLFNYLEKQDFTDTKEKIAVFISPDSPLPYIDEYFEFLDKEDFPSIENEYLLEIKEEFLPPQSRKNKKDEIQEVGTEEAFQIFFDRPREKVWNMLGQKKDIYLTKGLQIIDIRNGGEFEDHHIPNAINVPYYELDEYLKKNKRKLKKQKSVLFVCLHGNTSRLASYKAQMLGIKAINLKGGDTEWSRLNYPRMRADKCVNKYGDSHF